MEHFAESEAQSDGDQGKEQVDIGVETQAKVQ
jgi:hypothetical protein